MAIHWDNIKILQVIDEEQERLGGVVYNSEYVGREATKEWLACGVFVMGFFTLFFAITTFRLVGTNKKLIAVQKTATVNIQNQQALQKCIGDAQQLNALDPSLYTATNLQAAVSACQAKYTSN